MDILFSTIEGFFRDSGFMQFFQNDGYKFVIMIIVALFFIYLAIVKKY